MTTSRQMSNFKRLAERLSQGERLLTVQEKRAIMANRSHGPVTAMVEPTQRKQSVYLLAQHRSVI